MVFQLGNLVFKEFAFGHLWRIFAILIDELIWFIGLIILQVYTS